MAPHIALTLRPYTTACEMWNHLKTVYHQEDATREFQLEKDLRDYTQGDKSIQDYYSGFVALWLEYASLIYTIVPPNALSAMQKLHETSKRHQFLMNLRNEFEPIRAMLMGRHPTPTLDMCFKELLREEQRLKSLTQMEQQKVFGHSNVAYAAHATPRVSNPIEVAFSAQGRAKPRDISKIQCYSCREYDHYASQCKNKVCNYCKKLGHHIGECPRRPQNRPKAYHAYVSPPQQHTVPPPSVASADIGSASSSLTPELVHQMIQSAFSAMGFLGLGNEEAYWEGT